MEAQTGEPPALFGLETGAAIERVESLGLGWAVVRADDPRGRLAGPDVVLAGRYGRDGRVDLIVGSTYPGPEAGS